MADILSRVRKLLDLSRNNPSQEEAAQAAALAQDLMFRYQIGEADLEVDDGKREVEKVVDEAIFSKKGRRELWQACLANAVAYGFGCYMYNSGEKKYEPRKQYRPDLGGEAIVGYKTKETHRFQVVGLASAVQTVSYVYAYLVREIDQLCEQAWNEHGKEQRQSPRVWKNSFRMGAVGIIRTRLAEQRKQQGVEVERLVEQAREAQAPQSTALALYKSDQERVQDTVKDTEKRLGLRVGRGARFTKNLTAYQHGRAAGQNVQLGGGRGLGAPAKQVEG